MIYLFVFNYFCFRVHYLLTSAMCYPRCRGGIRRAPYGARGLKYSDRCALGGEHSTSRPAWGAWIEIDYIRAARAAREVAPRMGRVD